MDQVPQCPWADTMNLIFKKKWENILELLGTVKDFLNRTLIAVLLKTINI